MTLSAKIKRGADIQSRYNVVLPELPKSWTYRQFQDILDVQGGSQPPKSTFVFEPTPGYIQLLQIRDFGDRGVPTYVREDLVTKRRKEEDILIARYGASLGRMVTGQAGAYNVALAKVIFDKSVFYGKCLYYLLQTAFFQTPLHMISRSAQNGFNKGDLSDIVLPVAPLNEQHRIVAKIEELFSDLDAGVAALNRAKANLKRYRASVLKAAVVGKLTEEWRANHPATEPASALLARILKERRQKWEADQLAKFAGANKEPPKNWREKYVEPTHETGLFELPKSWTWASALEICEQVENGNTPPAHEMFEQVGDVPFIKVYNLTKNGSLDFSINPTFVSRKTHNTLLRRSRILPNDVLMNIVGPPLGKVSVVTDEYPEWNTNQAVVQFRARSGVLPRFLAACLMCDDVLLWIIRTARATAGQYNISVGNSRLLPLPLPPAKEQAAIVEILDESLSQIAAAETIIEHGLFRASRLRQSILKQAFEGKLVPQDPTDEPASVLLERLRASKSVHEGSGKPTAYVRTRGRRAKSKQASPPGEEAER